MNKNKKIKKILFVILIVFALLVGLVTVINITKDPPREISQSESINVSDLISQSTNSAGTLTPFTGTFKDGDAIHSGAGQIRVVLAQEGPILVFDDNFSVTNGPDLFVYISPNSAGQALGTFASLGKLKSTNGSQAYNLPSDYANYKTVVIWCRAFNTTFATAELTVND